MSEDYETSRKEIEQAWNEIEKVQRGERTVNVTDAAGWLRRGEKALVQKTPDCGTAKYCTAMARYELIKAQESAKYHLLGYLAVLIEFLYLGLTVALVVSVSSFGTSLAKLESITVFYVPLFVLVWGFLGGVAYCLYGAAYWSNRRLFDAHYFPWYLAHPWISVVLSGAMAILIIGGLSALGTFDPRSVQGVAVLSVTSFIAGFSTHEFWKILDRTIKKILGGKERESVAQGQAKETAPQL